MAKNSKFKDELREILDETRKDLLDKGENIIPYSAYEKFRSLVLNTFGHRGLKPKLDRIFEVYGQSISNPNIDEATDDDYGNQS